MGMPVSIAVRGEFPSAARDEAVALLHEIDARFSPYRPDSEISRLDSGDLVAAEAHPDVLEVLEACEGLRVDTGGWFDVWATPAGQPPRLDPCGYVKGWAVDRVVDVLADHGLRSFFVNAGGDVVARADDDEPPWRVGVQHPTEPMQVAAVVAAHRFAIATSGAYARGAHIVDPHTGGTPSGLASITLLGERLSTVDALATAAFAMGVAGVEWAAAHDGYGVFAVTDDGRTLSDEAFEARRVA
jgi:thiamine biosynthesis lipoprotein